MSETLTTPTPKAEDEAASIERVTSAANRISEQLSGEGLSCIETIKVCCILAAGCAVQNGGAPNDFTFVRQCLISGYTASFKALLRQEPARSQPVG